MKRLIKKLAQWCKMPEAPLRGIPRVTTVGIFCGNCANRWKMGGRLTRTFLTTAGRCNGCGGRSYVLASLYSPLVATRIRREREPAVHFDLDERAYENIAKMEEQG